MSNVLGKHTEVKNTIKCPVIPIDNIIQDLGEISLIKIDVQGYEIHVLRGAKKTLRKTRYILVEMNYFNQYKKGSNFVEVHEELSRNGFKMRNLSKPHIMKGRAVYSDALYENNHKN
jgi:hypothetical protein